MSKKHLVKILVIAASIFAIAFALPLSAQVVLNNLWHVNNASSTIVPNNSALQVPCANTVGGCSSGSATTTINGAQCASFTFSINGITSTSNITTSSCSILLNLLALSSSSDITISPTGTIAFASHNISQFTNDAGYGTSNVSTSSPNTWSAPQTFASTSPSQINSLQSTSTLYIPANYATKGCPWNLSDFDLGGCIMDAASSVSSTATSTHIHVPALPPFTSYTTPINFNKNGQYVSLDCEPGQILWYAGPNASSAITFNEGQATAANIKLSIDLGHNCHFAGGTTTNAFATSTGITIGGSNGMSGFSLYNYGAINFGTGWVSGANTYMYAIFDAVADGNVRNLQVNSASNSGETEAWYSPKFLDGASTTIAALDTCVDVLNNGNTELDMYAPSFDDCGWTFGSGVENVKLDGPNYENPAALTNLNYPAYHFGTIVSSTATNVVSSGGNLQSDASSTTSTIQSAFLDGASLTFNGLTVARNKAETITNLVDASINFGVSQFQEQGIYSAAAGTITNMVSTTQQVYPILPSFNTQGLGLSATQSGGNVTLTAQSPTFTYFTNAAAGTSTLPKASLSQGELFIFKSRGTASVLINANTSTPDFIWDLNKNATSTGYKLFAGSSVMMYNDGTYWLAFAGNGPQQCTPYVDQATGNIMWVYVTSTVVTASTTTPLSCQ